MRSEQPPPVGRSGSGRRELTDANRSINGEPVGGDQRAEVESGEQCRRWGPGRCGTARAAAAFTTRADGDASQLVHNARKARTKAARRLAAASTEPDPQQRDEALHRARKAVKRARYAAELVAPVTGEGTAKHTTKKLKQAQEALGEHHDSVVAAGLLRRLGAAAGTAPHQNGFTYGLLYARERQAADRAVRQAAALRL